MLEQVESVSIKMRVFIIKHIKLVLHASRCCTVIVIFYRFAVFREVNGKNNISES